MTGDGILDLVDDFVRIPGSFAIDCSQRLAREEGIFVGISAGATETFDAFNEGKLQMMLSSNSVIYNRGTDLDPYSLLPNWLHPRQDPTA